jgi:hypothetical protein
MTVMLVLGVIVAVIGLALASRVLVPRLKRRRILSEIRGDWWPSFEREFNAYAGTWRAAREAERRSH